MYLKPEGGGAECDVYECLVVVVVCSAAGCADTAVAANTTVVREGDRLTVRCNHSDQVWYLVCINSTWHGDTINCYNGTHCAPS